MVLPLLLGAASALYGIAGQIGAQHGQKKRLQQILNIEKQQAAEQALASSDAERYARQNLAQTKEAYSSAAQQAALSYGLNRSALGAITAQGLGATKAGLAGRGLYNTTALETANRGVLQSQAQALGSLDAQYGASLGDLARAKTSAVGGALGDLAAARQRSAAALNALRAAQVGRLSDISETASDVDLSPLAKVLGDEQLGNKLQDFFSGLFKNNVNSGFTTQQAPILYNDLPNSLA